MKKCSILLLAATMLVASAFSAMAAEKLIVYTSMKESIIGALKEGFTKKHPDIAMDYQSAGAGKLMAKVATERQSGKIMADVIWTSEVPDFFNMRAEGILEKYESPELKYIINPFSDYDGTFTAVRLGTLGIAYNTRYVKQAPTQWSDVTKPEYKKAFGIANPALSGTAYMSIQLLVDKFGWEYIEKISKNGGRIGKGSGQVVDDTASGDLLACIGVDYIVNDKIKKGASLALAYPPEMLVIPSPVAIFKGTPNLDAAKKFVDYLLSEEGQKILAEQGTLPVRKGITPPKEYNLPTSEEAFARGIKIDYQKVLTEKEASIKKFTDIMMSK
ncbi:MAG: ABC transporter substrate-binding protein [Desulfovibrio sp.]|uniref:ABC transporter substrate-binding protein n=1 Tax=Desulfovibrio sp. TaxID=885 RepID=UPI002A359BBB|nr:ABC transporter substrate-binding protein [Desulfovibrio sp.]MDY0259420.1 ABC transporter substrate-binding protein [Desulfovibrio sp.]